ncbi:MAG: hypothetical protein J0I32_23145 [Sphingobacteriales bacterium]|nr:hypothetical protein [Sphingobacteriales bacterium]OJW01940.1 MAG: hypothetical protein BGO52_00190 [Sphingobacteriales bacterium 44-61]
MKEPHLMRTITYDSVELTTDQTVYDFFKDWDDVRGDRYNAEIEANLVRRILNNPYDASQSLLYDELLIPRSYNFFTEVKGPIITDSASPGDIDILGVDKNNPHLAIGIQVKRIKAWITEEDKAIVKANQIGKGVEQTRYMFKKYRFHKNYLMLVIVADTMYRRNDCQIFRNLSLDEKQDVYRHPALKELPEQAGVFTYEISQPSSNAVHLTGTLAAKVLKAAVPVEQESSTTESVIQFLRMQG